MPKKFKLFSVFGIEAEYMIVEKQGLQVRPIADKILQELNGGEICNEVEIGPVSWSNELVNHVLEIKCSEPVSSLDRLDQIFHQSILKINTVLNQYDCVLMPTAMHPWFNPDTETQLWPHDQREIYNLYHEIFNCRGHGWSNLQSVHINLPYSNEDEFYLLHTAIRATLPIIPALAASSPFFDGKKGLLADNRLSFYEKNQAKVPSVIGNIIPEYVKSTSEYKKILEKIYKDISHYDHAKTLQNPWLNSRAAIPKFDVGAIEIRLMDIQECPYMDMAIVQLIVAKVKSITENEDSFSHAKQLSDSFLREIYDESKKFNPTKIFDEYNEFLGVHAAKSWHDLIKDLITKYKSNIPEFYHRGLDKISEKGNLAQRLSENNLDKNIYQNLIKCLSENKVYE